MMIVIALIALVSTGATIGVVDYFYQRYSHNKSLRMKKEEVKDEGSDRSAWFQSDVTLTLREDGKTLTETEAFFRKDGTPAMRIAYFSRASRLLMCTRWC